MAETLKQQFTRLVVNGAFDAVHRRLSSIDADDRLAEALGMVWALALRKSEAGIRLDDALVVHAVRLRAQDLRRQLPRGGQARRDVMHRSNSVDGRVEVLHLDGLLDDDGDFASEEDRAIHLAISQRTSRDPAPFLDSAIDLGAWLAQLEDDDRAIVAARYGGDSLKEIGAATGRSISGVFSRLRELGNAVADRAGVTITKKQSKSRGTAMRPMEPCAA
jgi:DNA-directed RNA polymerase specialized sigma24 family protein